MWPSKGTNCYGITSFEPLSFKIATKLWPVAATKKRTDRQTDMLIKNPHKTCFSRMRRSVTAESIPTKCLHINSMGGDVVIYLTWHRSRLSGFGGVGCENGPLPLTLALASNSVLRYRAYAWSAPCVNHRNSSWNNVNCNSNKGGSVAEWLACWTQAQKGLSSYRSRDAVE